jgi:hypothetical protein
MTLKVPHTSYLAGVTFRVPLQLVLATRVAALCPACTGQLRRAAVTDLDRDPVACPVPGLQQRVRAATSSASRIGPVGPPGFGAPLGRSQAIRMKSCAGSIPALRLRSGGSFTTSFCRAFGMSPVRSVRRPLNRRSAQAGHRDARTARVNRVGCVRQTRDRSVPPSTFLRTQDP